MNRSQTNVTNLEEIYKFEFQPDVAQIISIVSENYQTRPKFAIIDLRDNLYGLSILDSFVTRDSSEQNTLGFWESVRLNLITCWCFNNRANDN